MPPAIRQALASKVEAGQANSAGEIENLLRDSISAFDNEMTKGLLDLFPGGVEAIATMSDDEIRSVAVVDGRPHQNIARCMGGTTALIALVDPTRSLYVASLGDCVACTVCLSPQELSTDSVPQYLDAERVARNGRLQF